MNPMEDDTTTLSRLRREVWQRPREPQSHQTSRHPHPVSLFRRSLMSRAHQLTLHSQAPGPVYLWQIAYKPWLHKTHLRVTV
ncbi:hypothetical protein HPB52_020945 [Rhipicephalus sanguineus]|uniref:Uncharacterized protein n=1 Tax=Rhipicephalus sanguineus TaxID=34632 RepID=A0A9D4Q882_RHISA|nr:hypothetical protein HPB52_020945 [Rhipicephalus sanguineus]